MKYCIKLVEIKAKWEKISDIRIDSRLYKMILSSELGMSNTSWVHATTQGGIIL